MTRNPLYSLSGPADNLKSSRHGAESQLSRLSESRASGPRTEPDSEEFTAAGPACGGTSLVTGGPARSSALSRGADGERHGPGRPGPGGVTASAGHPSPSRHGGASADSERDPGPPAETVTAPPGPGRGFCHGPSP
jgi:hypothetical protein